jgi:hypothetical protein
MENTDVLGWGNFHIKAGVVTGPNQAVFFTICGIFLLRDSGEGRRII